MFQQPLEIRFITEIIGYERVGENREAMSKESPE
jgi:hypothetical protein